MIDLEPAARRTADLVQRPARGSRCGAPTPCPAYTVGDLVEHIGGLAMAFTGPPPTRPTASSPSSRTGRRCHPAAGRLADPDPRATWSRWRRPGAIRPPGRA